MTFSWFNYAGRDKTVSKNNLLRLEILNKTERDRQAEYMNGICYAGTKQQGKEAHRSSEMGMVENAIQLSNCYSGIDRYRHTNTEKRVLLTVR